MREAQQLKRLRNLQSEIDKLRQELGISAPDSICYRAEKEDQEVIVLSDGFGGATLLVADGNFPVDYSTMFEEFFSKEEDALNKADFIVLSSSTVSEILETTVSL